MSATARLLPDGRRLHLQHGPIDLVIEAFGPRAAIERAYARAAAAFPPILPALVDELAILRQPLGETPPAVTGPVARRMIAACWPHRAAFITPMAAVAGAVADAMLRVLTADGDLARAYVNNGGDIAIQLADGERLTAGLVADIAQPALHGTIGLDSAWPVRGLATSGWRGRSVSRGIADAVTVLAADAATADAAATMVANAVDIDHPAIRRAPASTVRDDSDLGALPVTVAVGALSDEAVGHALANGRHTAERLVAAGLIAGAVLVLQGRTCVVPADLPALAHAPIRESAA